MAGRTSHGLKSQHKISAKGRHRLVHEKTPAQEGQEYFVAQQPFNALGERLAHHTVLFRLLGQGERNDHSHTVQQQKRHPDRRYGKMRNILRPRIGPYGRSYAQHHPDAPVSGAGLVRRYNGVGIGNRRLCRGEDGRKRINHQQNNEILRLVKNR
ncbi:hypothetical protein D3C85_1417930 [compost metagenome]